MKMLKATIAALVALTFLGALPATAQTVNSTRIPSVQKQAQFRVLKLHDYLFGGTVSQSTGIITGTVLDPNGLIVPLTSGTNSYITGTRYPLMFQAAGGNYTAVTVGSAMGQNTVITIPDPGATAASFVLAAGAGAPVTIYHAQYQMTVANVTGMYGTTVPILAAVTGKTIVIKNIVMTYTEGGGAYAAGGVVSCLYHGGNTCTGSVAATAITAASGSTYSVLQPVSVIGLQGVGIDITNATQAFTQSAATGAPLIDIYYQLN